MSVEIPIEIDMDVTEEELSFDMEMEDQVLPAAWNYLGANPVKILDIPETETALSDTEFNTWTPSTTAKVIKDSENAATIDLDTANYDYVMLWYLDTDLVYNGSETNAAKLTRAINILRAEVIKRPSSRQPAVEGTFNGNANVNYSVVGFVDYYDSNGSQKINYTTQGFYLNFAASTFSSNTADDPTLTVKTPQIRAQCNASYLSTGNASKLNKSNSKIKLRGEVWRIDKRSVLGEMYKKVIDIYNA